MKQRRVFRYDLEFRYMQEGEEIRIRRALSPKASIEQSVPNQPMQSDGPARAADRQGVQAQGPLSSISRSKQTFLQASNLGREWPVYLAFKMNIQIAMVQVRTGQLR